VKMLGIILIVVGALALVYQGFSYTQTKKDAQLGPLEIQHQETHDVPIPPVVGGVCIVAGVLALALGTRGGTP
jgi:UDP-N-acetylmuramyl pentapeptide phosphotransferase/UDP-N-acetylglucosamine-1-phosphate transferase